MRREHRDARVWANGGINPRVQDLRQILGLIRLRLAADDKECANGKNGERTCADGNQPADRPPRRAFATVVSARGYRAFIARDCLAQLVIEKIGVAHRLCRELLFKKSV